MRPHAMRMSLLALDTAGPDPSVAVFRRGEIFEEKLPPGGRASEDLLPAVARAFAAASLSLDDCERIAVCAGPGSFTGVRVGLATAWGIGRARGLPVEAVSTLEAMAEAARVWGVPRIAAFLDAGRGELVGGIFDLAGDRARLLAEPTRLPASDAGRFAAGARLAALPADLVPSAEAPPTSLAAALALAVGRAPRRAPDPLSAIYSRPSAAEEKHGAS
jgi:tRNA threonylcarbamoyladenosine biosynthesis protein TsaB